MKRIKVTAMLFILFSAGLMNYHDQSMSSVKFSNRAEVISYSEKVQPPKFKPCPKSESDYSGTQQELSSGKNYEAIMVIM